MFRRLVRCFRRPTSVPATFRGKRFRPLLETLEGRLAPATFSWVATTDGDFNTAANWRDQNNNPGVPGANDDASIGNGSITVTLGSSHSVNSLISSARFHITAGTLTIANVAESSVISSLVLDSGTTLQVNGGTTSLIGSEIAGTLSVAETATLRFLRGTNNLNAGAVLTGTGNFLEQGDAFGGPTVNVNTNLTAPLHFELKNGILAGSGTLTIASVFTWSGGTIGGAGTLTVAANGTVNIPGPDSVLLDTRTLNNAGTINWTSPSSLGFANSGVLNNQSGANFNIQTDADVGAFGIINNAGTITKTSPVGTGTTLVDSALNSTGAVSVQTGTLQLNRPGTSSGTFTVAAGATLRFTGDHTFNTGAAWNGTGQYVLQGGTLTLNSNLSVANSTQSGSVLTGTGTYTVTNTMTWSDGAMSGTGSTTIAAGATLAITTASSVSVNTRTLNAAGTVNWTGTGAFILTNGGTFNISNTGVFNIQTDADVGAIGAINNAGTVNKTSPTGTGTTQIDSLFHNTGTVNVQTGTLALSRGGSNAGVLNVAATGTLAFTGGTHAFNTGSTVAGAGFARLAAGGQVAVNANVSVANWGIDGGILSGANTFTVTGILDWTGGSINNPNGTVALAAAGTLTIRGNADRDLNGGTLRLAGTTTWTNNGDIGMGNGATITIPAGGTFSIQNDRTLGGNGTFTNAGTLEKNGGPGITSLTGSIAFSNNGGTVRVLTGTLSFSGTYTQNSGSTTVAAGTTLAATTANIAGGTLSGPGTLQGNVTNAGTVSPGASPGVLTVTGTYTQTAAGRLLIELGGTTVGTGYDRLAVGGAATLAGTLDVVLVNSFSPAVGNSFQPLTFASRTGDFATRNGLLVGSGAQLTPTLSATNLTLTAAAFSPGTLRFSGTSYTGGESQGSAVITVTRTGGSDGTVTVQYATSNGGAAAGLDYTTSSGTLSFAPGETTRTFTVPILGDFLVEGSETVNLALSSVTGGATLGTAAATLVILDDDVAGQLQLAAATFEAREGSGTATITVTRTGGSDGTVTVQYATGGGTATVGTDYTTATGTLTFNQGETSKTFTIALRDDVTAEVDETVNLALTNPTGGAALGGQATAVLTIKDDDGIPRVVTSFDAGGPPLVRVFHAGTGTQLGEFHAYGPTFLGGVRLALADVNGDAVPDIFTAPGPGGAPFVNLFDGQTLQFVRQIQVYGNSFTLGVNLTVGNVLGDARPEIIVAPDRGGEPFVNVFDSQSGQLLEQFLAYGQTFTSGVRVAVGNTDAANGALGEILTAPQAGGAAFVNQFEAATGRLIRQNQVYGDAFTGGVFLAAGDVDGNGLDDLIVGPGSGGDPFVNALDGTSGALIRQYQAFGSTFTGGVRVAAVRVNGDLVADILAVPGRGGQPLVKVLDGATRAQLGLFAAYEPYAPTVDSGLFAVASR